MKRRYFIATVCALSLPAQSRNPRRLPSVDEVREARYSSCVGTYLELHDGSRIEEKEVVAAFIRNLDPKWNEQIPIVLRKPIGQHAEKGL